MDNKHKHIWTQLKAGVAFHRGGCCIGTEHNCPIVIHQDTLQRIKGLVTKATKFYAEGAAAKDVRCEIFMRPFMQQYFPDHDLEPDSWDELISDEVTKNIFLFYPVLHANYQVNVVPEEYGGTATEDAYEPASTMFESVYKGMKKMGWPNGVGPDRNLLKIYLRKGGLLHEFEKPYDREGLYDLLYELEEQSWDGQVPNQKTEIGKIIYQAEYIRNGKIVELMSEGGICFAGGGHTDELELQYGVERVEW